MREKEKKKIRDTKVFSMKTQPKIKNIEDNRFFTKNNDANYFTYYSISKIVFF